MATSWPRTMPWNAPSAPASPACTRSAASSAPRSNGAVWMVMSQCMSAPRYRRQNAAFGPDGDVGVAAHDLLVDDQAEHLALGQRAGPRLATAAQLRQQLAGSTTGPVQGFVGVADGVFQAAKIQDAD